MKIEKIDGELFVILEENDRVSITTQEQLGKNNITIAKNEENIRRRNARKSLYSTYSF